MSKVTDLFILLGTGLFLACWKTANTATIRLYAPISYSERYDKIDVGMTSDPETRFFAHNHLPKGWTRQFRPWELLYHEDFAEKTEALKREKGLKSHRGRDFIRSLIGDKT